MSEKSWQIDKIIEVAHCLAQDAPCGASTSEIIAGAFVLNRADLFPRGYEDMIDAWDRLGVPWQWYVREAKRYYPGI